MMTWKIIRKLLDFYRFRSHEHHLKACPSSAMGKQLGWSDLSLQLLFVCALSIRCMAQKNTSTFLSIDCGGSEAYTDIFGIDWVPDDAYMQTGEKVRVDLLFEPGNEPFKHSRIFADGRSKHCYVLPQEVGVTYLLRAAVLHGGVNSIPLPVDFNVTMNGNFWFTHTISQSDSTTLVNTPLIYESIYYSTSEEVNVCLIKGTSSIPFISSISLRGLNSMTYLPVLSSKFFVNQIRYNNGLDPNITRFPEDDYDRFWFPTPSKTFPQFEDVVNATSLLVTSPNTLPGFNLPPQKVMMDAWTAPVISVVIYFPTFVGTLYIAFYFQELRSNYSADDPRGVIISAGHGNPYELNITQKVHQIYYDSLHVNDYQVNITIEKQNWSSYDPILNAMEIYNYVDIDLSAIDQTDAASLQSVQASFNLTDWTGDPCYPVSWNWITCDPTSLTVITLNLSRMSLTGEIPSQISGLKSLEEIYLDNNKLTGSIPTSIFNDLSRLKVLKLDDNNLSGYVPIAFQNRTGFTFAGNPELSFCLPGNSCDAGRNLRRRKSASNIGVVVGAVGGAVFAICIALCVFICCYRRHRRKRSTRNPNQSAFAQESVPKSRTDGGGKFHYSASGGISGPHSDLPNVTDLPLGFISADKIIAATQNYARKIGEGGYGLVFYGQLSNGKEVAVKVNKLGAQQGPQEFMNEVTLLTRVHHKNLVSLIHFCEEDGKRILVYEYLSNGSLSNLLYGPNAAARPLDWKTRLDIALNAAKGLEYLHTGCSPRIIHRDVKSNNILIDDKFVAKVADFGISKATPDADYTTDGAFSTLVRGSPGYLDPEYFLTQKLSHKSDVYSFGVVLMEIMAGTRPVVRSENGDQLIVDLVKSAMQRGDLLSITDPALGHRFNPESVWKVAELARLSVDEKGVNRPDMIQIVRGLAEAVELEMSYPPDFAPRSRSSSIAAGGTSSRSLA